MIAASVELWGKEGESVKVNRGGNQLESRPARHDRRAGLERCVLLGTATSTHSAAGLGLLLRSVLGGRLAAASLCLIAALGGLPAALLRGGATGFVLAAAILVFGTATGLCRCRTTRFLLRAAGHLGLATIPGFLVRGNVRGQETNREQNTGHQFQQHDPPWVVLIRLKIGLRTICAIPSFCIGANAARNACQSGLAKPEAVAKMQRQSGSRNRTEDGDLFVEGVTDTWRDRCKVGGQRVLLLFRRSHDGAAADLAARLGR